jgi:hypothetical protein
MPQVRGTGGRRATRRASGRPLSPGGGWRFAGGQAPRRPRGSRPEAAREARWSGVLPQAARLRFPSCGFRKSQSGRASQDRYAGRPKPGRMPMPLNMNREVFITCAVTGSGGTQDRSPACAAQPQADRRKRDRGGQGGGGGGALPCARPRNRQAQPQAGILPRGDGAHPGQRHRCGPEPDGRDGRRHLFRGHRGDGPHRPPISDMAGPRSGWRMSSNVGPKSARWTAAR